MKRDSEREKEKTRKEYLAKFFYDLAKLAFASVVVSGIMNLKEDENTITNVLYVTIGLLVVVLFSYTGNKFLK